MRWHHWLILTVVFLVVIAITLNRKRVMKKFENIRLGPNFMLSEFIQTSTGLDNIPGPTEITNLELLVKYSLQPLRTYVGVPFQNADGVSISLNITSGYRSPAVNADIEGSSKTSQHMKGQASDFNILISYSKKKFLSEVSARADLNKRLSQIGLLSSDVYLVEEGGWHHKDFYRFRLTNDTIIATVRKLKLPYDQIIDEERGTSKWVHVSYNHNAANGGRREWLTRRDPGPNRPKEYELVKIG